MLNVNGKCDASHARFAIVAARWNPEITEELLKGAYQAILHHGGKEDSIVIVRVPGSFEIPLACKQLAISKNFDAVIAIGTLIRGETEHFRLIADQVASGLAQVMLESGIPITFGVITANSLEDARVRAVSPDAADRQENRGWEAATAAIEFVSLLQELKKL